MNYSFMNFSSLQQFSSNLLLLHLLRKGVPNLPGKGDLDHGWGPYFQRGPPNFIISPSSINPPLSSAALHHYKPPGSMSPIGYSDPLQDFQLYSQIISKLKVEAQTTSIHNLLGPPVSPLCRYGMKQLTVLLHTQRWFSMHVYYSVVSPIKCVHETQAARYFAVLIEPLVCFSTVHMYSSQPGIMLTSKSPGSVNYEQLAIGPDWTPGHVPEQLLLVPQHSLVVDLNQRPREKVSMRSKEAWTGRSSLLNSNESAS